MRSNKLLVGCGIVVIVALLLAIAGVLFGPSLIPKVSASVGQSEGVQVFLVQPVSGSTLAVNKPVEVSADAVGLDGLEKMQLWVDNHLWEAGAVSTPAGKTMNSKWVWTPVEEGQYTLMVRATDANGAASNSNLIQVNIVAEEAVPTPDPLLPVDPSTQPPAGGMASGDVPPPPPFPPEEDPPPVDDKGIEVIGNLGSGLFFTLEPPKAPKIWAKRSTDSCDIELRIQDKSDNESGFVVERITVFQNSLSSEIIAKLDAHKTTGVFKYIDTLVGAEKYEYMVYAVNKAGNTMSNVVTVSKTNKVCQNPAGYTPVGASNTIIKPEKKVTKMYCYMSTNGVDWTRIPSNPNEFITGTNGEFDVKPYLGEPGGLAIELDCWGWDGDTLIHLGKIVMTYELIAPPKNFHFVSNADECGNAGTSPADKTAKIGICKNFQQIGFKIVMWDWHPKPIQICAMSDWACWQKLIHYTANEIDGFSVYYNYPIGPVQKVFTLNGQELRFGFIIPKPQQGLLKPEYYVRAFKGTMESADSSHKNP